MNLDNNSSGMLWLVRNAIDIDGRDTVTDQMLVDGAQLFTNIKYLYDDTPYLSEFPHNPPSPYGRLTFDLNPVKAAIIIAIDGGDTLSLVLRIQIGDPVEDPPPFSTELGRFAVTLDSFCQSQHSHRNHDQQSAPGTDKRGKKGEPIR